MVTLWADFNALDADGRVLLSTVGSLRSLAATPVAPGAEVLLTDDEVTVPAVIERNEVGALVAVWRAPQQNNGDPMSIHLKEYYSALIPCRVDLAEILAEEIEAICKADALIPLPKLEVVDGGLRIFGEQFAPELMTHISGWQVRYDVPPFGISFAHMPDKGVAMRARIGGSAIVFMGTCPPLHFSTHEWIRTTLQSPEGRIAHAAALLKGSHAVTETEFDELHQKVLKVLNP